MGYNGRERGDFMSKYTGYTQQQNKATQKYIKEKRDRFGMNLPKGKLEEYRAKAKEKGLSLSAYIVKLIEEDK